MVEGWINKYQRKTKTKARCYRDDALGAVVHRFELGQIRCCCGQIVLAEDRVNHGWRKTKPEPS